MEDEKEQCDYDVDCKDVVVEHIMGMRYCSKHGSKGHHIWQLDCRVDQRFTNEWMGQ